MKLNVDLYILIENLLKSQDLKLVNVNNVLMSTIKYHF